MGPPRNTIRAPRHQKPFWGGLEQLLGHQSKNKGTLILTKGLEQIRGRQTKNKGTRNKQKWRPYKTNRKRKKHRRSKKRKPKQTGDEKHKKLKQKQTKKNIYIYIHKENLRVARRTKRMWEVPVQDVPRERFWRTFPEDVPGGCSRRTLPEDIPGGRFWSTFLEGRCLSFAICAQRSWTKFLVARLDDDPARRWQIRFPDGVLR